MIEIEIDQITLSGLLPTGCEIQFFEDQRSEIILSFSPKYKKQIEYKKIFVVIHEAYNIQ